MRSSHELHRYQRRRLRRREPVHPGGLHRRDQRPCQHVRHRRHRAHPPAGRPGRVGDLEASTGQDVDRLPVEEDHLRREGLLPVGDQLPQEQDQGPREGDRRPRQAALHARGVVHLELPRDRLSAGARPQAHGSGRHSLRLPADASGEDRVPEEPEDGERQGHGSRRGHLRDGGIRRRDVLVNSGARAGCDLSTQVGGRSPPPF